MTTPSGQVLATRLAAFTERHPEITITPPGRNGTLMWRATWLTVSGAAAEGSAEEAGYDDPGRLLAYLEARFDRSIAWP